MTLLIRIILAGKSSYVPIDMVEAAVREVRKEGWTGTRGIQDGFKEKFKGKLNASKYGGWTSVTFTKEPDYQNFMVLTALFM